MFYEVLFVTLSPEMFEPVAPLKASRCTNKTTQFYLQRDRKQTLAEAGRCGGPRVLLIKLYLILSSYLSK